MVSSSAARRSGAKRVQCPDSAAAGTRVAGQLPRRRSAACTRGPRPPRDGAHRHRSAGSSRCRIDVQPGPWQHGASFPCSAGQPTIRVDQSVEAPAQCTERAGQAPDRPHREHCALGGGGSFRGGSRPFRPTEAHSGRADLHPGQGEPEAATCGHAPPRRVPCRLPSARPPAARTRWRSGRPRVTAARKLRAGRRVASRWW